VGYNLANLLIFYCWPPTWYWFMPRFGLMVIT